jgi:hypothetical protein
MQGPLEHDRESVAEQEKPTGYVVCVLPPGVDLAAAIRSVGRSADEIVPVTANRYLERHKPDLEGVSAIHRARDALAPFLSEEHRYAEPYLDWARSGHDFLFVWAPTEEDAREVLRAVEPFEPVSVREYRDLVITDLA